LDRDTRTHFYSGGKLKRNKKQPGENTMTQIIPHIGFDGNAEEAFNFYKSVFGGELSLMRWKDNPSCSDWSEEDKNKIMHAALKIGDGTLMGNDVPKVMGQTVKAGNNFTVTLNPNSRDEADRLFSGLSAGGNPTMPMQEMFWGGYFGSFTDKFGIPWMINYATQGREASAA